MRVQLPSVVRSRHAVAALMRQPENSFWSIATRAPLARSGRACPVELPVAWQSALRPVVGVVG